MTVVVVMAIAYASEEGVCDAKALMDYASNATSPPPPNKGGKGTQVTSKTLYNKGGKNDWKGAENPWVLGKIEKRAMLIY